jgi:hypothetical protein
LLLGLWRRKAFICLPSAFVQLDSCAREEYVHVVDGML